MTSLSLDSKKYYLMIFSFSQRKVIFSIQRRSLVAVLEVAGVR